MQTLRVMAVDDEALALRRIELALAAVGGAELVATAYSGHEAGSRLAQVRPDVLLLDIEMANGSGTELAAQLRGPGAPLVIFVTAFEDYAVEAFRLRAVDYVLKPVQFERLAEALENARRTLKLSQADRTAADLARALSATNAQPSATRSDHLWVDGPRGVTRIAIAQVEWFEAERDYVRVHVGAQSHLMRGPLSDVEAEVGDRFIRIRRSALVRRDAILLVRARTPSDRRVVLASGREVRVGKTYQRALSALIRGPG